MGCGIRDVGYGMWDYDVGFCQQCVQMDNGYGVLVWMTVGVQMMDMEVLMWIADLKNCEDKEKLCVGNGYWMNCI